jgi:hypothetical protein
MESSLGSSDPSGSAAMPSPPTATRRSSASAHGSGLLSKLSFMRTSSSSESRNSRQSNYENSPTSNAEARKLEGLASALQEQQLQQQRTRRRRGSLRKVALLGRGAQRERRESSRSTSEEAAISTAPRIITDQLVGEEGGITTSPMEEHDGYGLGISDITPRPSMDGYASRSATAQLAALNNGSPPKDTSSSSSYVPPKTLNAQSSFPDLVEPDSQTSSPAISYSTTDDEDALHMGSAAGAASAAAALLRPERASVSSSSDGYFPVSHATPLPSNGISSIQRRRSVQRAKSPLALTGLTGLAATPLPVQDTDWDYSETEWWGWVVLIVTWLVFVTGMGSCLGIWSWAWDVGTTPYAPPELEDDPTLPIVGYYPALIILSCVMAWVWVVVAWVGMKYFRHARVSGD